MIQDPREKAADACCLKRVPHSQVQSQPNKPCWEAHLSEVALDYLCTQDLQGLARRKKKRAVDDFLHCLLLLTFINVAHACMYAIFSFSFSESLHARAATWSHCGMLVHDLMTSSIKFINLSSWITAHIGCMEGVPKGEIRAGTRLYVRHAHHVSFHLSMLSWTSIGTWHVRGRTNFFCFDFCFVY